RIEEMVDAAVSSPEPASTPEAELADVYAPSGLDVAPPDGATRELRLVDAVREAMHVALKREERVILLGQDIAAHGGVFKATEGFVEEFGKERIRNTPIIESGAVGCAMGLALDGFLPVLELQFGDFITCGFNQVVNNLAKTYWRWGARIPVVLRLPV